MLSFGAVEIFTSFTFYEGMTKSFMDVVQDIFFVIALPLGGFLMSLFIATRWKIHNMSIEISKGNRGFLGSGIEKFFHLMIKYVCPVVLGIMFLLTILQKFMGISLF